MSTYVTETDLSFTDILGDNRGYIKHKWQKRSGTGNCEQCPLRINDRKETNLTAKDERYPAHPR